MERPTLLLKGTPGERILSGDLSILRIVSSHLNLVCSEIRDNKRGTRRSRAQVRHDGVWETSADGFGGAILPPPQNGLAEAAFC